MQCNNRVRVSGVPPSGSAPFAEAASPTFTYLLPRRCGAPWWLASPARCGRDTPLSDFPSYTVHDPSVSAGQLGVDGNGNGNGNSMAVVAW